MKKALTTIALATSLLFGNLNAQKKVINGVPAYKWTHGCSPTAFGMVAGYYDKNGMPNLIPGSAETQTDSVSLTIASAEHFNNFCLPLDTGLRRKPDKSEDAEFMKTYKPNCIADFLKISYSGYPSFCAYGQGHFDESSGVKRFFEYKGYSCDANSFYYNEKNWNNFKKEIDNKRPVVLDINLSRNTGHMVTAIGYNEEDTTYAFYNTWDKDIHWEKWGTNQKEDYSIYEQFYIKTDLDLSNVKFDTLGNEQNIDTNLIKITIDSLLNKLDSFGYDSIPYNSMNNFFDGIFNFEKDTLIQDSIIDIAKNKLENKIKMYPNPVSDILKIEGMEDAKVGIYDVSGRELERRVIRGNEINMNSYKPGVCIIKAESDGKIYTGKVVKK